MKQTKLHEELTEFNYTHTKNLHLSLAVEAIVKLEQKDGATFDQIWGFVHDKVMGDDQKKKEAFAYQLQRNSDTGNMIEVSVVQEESRYKLKQSFC